MRTRFVPALAAALALTLPAAARAQIITPGFTFAVATDNDACATGTHFHSNTGGAFGNPAGKAEVGNFSSECVRGLSEYDLTGLSASPTAFVTFDVFRAGGLFAGENDFPFSGSINVVAYQGNNAEDESDYQAPSAAAVGSFSTSSLVVGNTLSFDITSIFNSALADGWTSLGIRLQRDGASSTASGAWTFDTFRLTSDDQSTSVTPEPSTYLLLASGVGMIGVVTRRRRARQS